MAQPFSQQFPQLYADWVAAGGPEDNFRAHVLAVKPPGLVLTDADVAFSIAHTNGAFAQFADTLKNHGQQTGLAFKALVVGQ